MSFLVAWTPTFAMGAFFAIAGLVMLARARRIERAEREHKVAHSAGNDAR